MGGGEGMLQNNIGTLMCKYRAGLEEFQNYTWGGTVLRVKERKWERNKFWWDRAGFHIQDTKKKPADTLGEVDVSPQIAKGGQI